MADLIINNKDALQTWGVKIGEGFIDAIFAPSPLKEFIENKSRLENGKRVTYNNPKVDERDVTLVFNLEGISQADYLLKYKAFKAELEKGRIEIKVPVLGEEIYRLTYQKSTSFAMNTLRTFSKLSVKFQEANPADRT
ncbi:hypothetical protein [Bacteroides ihuae]|uniref:hypothetical protein n=1 Tax=Bacteroides ihuae TaxID=1852362 RepID=UPI0008DAA04A|nr:hypothetical protein [Bacteroides ihuae]